MGLPGFTGAGSLYETHNHYRPVAMSPGGDGANGATLRELQWADNTRLIPQAPGTPCCKECPVCSCDSSECPPGKPLCCVGIMRECLHELGQCLETRKNCVNCPSGQICTDQGCCNPENACGLQRCCDPSKHETCCISNSLAVDCCPQGVPCTDQGCCSSPNIACGVHCCSGQKCSPGGCCYPDDPGRICDGECTPEGCCDPSRICNDHCCGPQDSCTEDGCCPPDQAVCNGHCCPLNKPCCNGACCNNPNKAPEACTDNAGCCPADQTCNDYTTCNVPVGKYLHGNSNYFLADSNYLTGACQDILGLTVTLNVTQDIVSDNGFTIQLNANSPAGGEPDAWQQYAVRVTGNSIQAQINNWGNATTVIVCGVIDLCSTPISNGLPAGYTLSVILTNDRLSNVTGAVYQVHDSNGNQLANKSFPMSQAGCNCNMPPGDICTGFSEADLSPITAFTVGIVGLGSGAATTFSSGAGNITYSVSSGQLTPLVSEPACVEWNVVTAEDSNAAYGTLNACPAQTFTQPFFIGP